MEDKRKMKHIKESKKIKVKETNKDYAGTEASPYWENFDFSDSSTQLEPAEANPDILTEADGLWYSSPNLTEQQEGLLETINKIWPSLTARQQEVLRLCGYEGRSYANTAAILKISAGRVQKIIEKIRERIRSEFEGV